MSSKEEYSAFLSSVGKEWKRPDLLNSVDSEFVNKFVSRGRTVSLDRKFTLAHSYLSEYLKGGFDVLDVSCGDGALLEVMRYYENKILGTDIAHYPFLKSQNIPYRFVDCTKFLYPLEAKSYDLLTCIGSITFYLPCGFTWHKVLDEFARIARKTIFILVNKGIYLTRDGHFLSEWVNADWRLSFCEGSYYKWEHI